MDQKNDNLDDVLKEVELSLARTLLVQLDKGAITYEQSQEIARYILSEIDKVKDSGQLLTFLQELTGKWNIFENTRGLYRLKIMDSVKTDQKLEEVTNKLSQINNN